MSIVHVTEENFSSEVLEFAGTVLIDFHATWCAPCKALAPVLDELDAEGTGVKICKIDVDQAMEIAKKHRVMSVPTLVLVKNGEVVNRTAGYQSKEELLEFVK